MNLNIEPLAVAEANGLYDRAMQDKGEDMPLQVTPEGFIFDNFQSLNIPVPVSDPAMSRRLDFVKGAKQVRTFSGQEILVWIQGPYSIAGRIIGEADRSILHMVDPDKLNSILDYTVKVSISYAQALKDAGADLICMLEPSSGRLSDPDCFRSHTLDAVNRIIRAVDIPFIFHLLYFIRNVENCHRSCGYLYFIS